MTFGTLAILLATLLAGAGLVTLGLVRARIEIGAKVPLWRISIWPCLASSSEAAKVAAVAVRRFFGSRPQPSGR